MLETERITSRRQKMEDEGEGRRADYEGGTANNKNRSEGEEVEGKNGG